MRWGEDWGLSDGMGVEKVGQVSGLFGLRIEVGAAAQSSDDCRWKRASEMLRNG